MSDPYGNDEVEAPSDPRVGEILEMPDPPPPPGPGADAAQGYDGQPPPSPYAPAVAAPPRQLVQTFLGYDEQGRPIYSPATPAPRRPWGAFLAAAALGAVATIAARAWGVGGRRRPAKDDDEG